MRRAANALALLLVASAVACIALGAAHASAPLFRYAFAALLAAFAAIELRIRAGGRARRTPLLFFHIAAAVPFFLCVAALAFVARPVWLLYAMGVLGVLAAGSGIGVFLRPARA